MNSEEARIFQDLTFLVVDHDVQIPLPDGNRNLLNTTLVSFCESLKNANGDMGLSRKATRGRMIAANTPTETKCRLDLLRQIHGCAWAGNIKFVSRGPSGAQRNRYFTKRVRCDLGRNHFMDKKQPEREAL